MSGLGCGSASTVAAPPRDTQLFLFDADGVEIPLVEDALGHVLLPRLEQGEDVRTLEVGAEEKETKPPRRYSDASLLAAMETAGKLVDDDELREAMKDSGIGTPATRAAIIERLIEVGYVERDARSLVCTEKGLNVIRLLDGHALTSPGLTGTFGGRTTATFFSGSSFGFGSSTGGGGGGGGLPAGGVYRCGRFSRLTMPASAAQQSPGPQPSTNGPDQPSARTRVG